MLQSDLGQYTSTDAGAIAIFNLTQTTSNQLCTLTGMPQGEGQCRPMGGTARTVRYPGDPVRRDADSRGSLLRVGERTITTELGNPADVGARPQRSSYSQVFLMLCDSDKDASDFLPHFLET